MVPAAARCPVGSTARALVLSAGRATLVRILPPPAARYLDSHVVKPADYNQYGARRGNHEVMGRGTFANIRLENLKLVRRRGGSTRYFPRTGAPEQLAIYDAAMKYAADGR